MQRKLFIYLFIPLFILCVFYPSPSLAGLFSQYSFSYHSDEDSVDESSYSRMGNLLFLGANFDSKEKWIIGWDFLLWSRENKAGAQTANKVSLTQMGPRIQAFLNNEKNVYLSFSYHPYVKGTITSTTSEDVSGSGLLFGLGYQFKITGRFYMGASISYQSTSLDKSTENSIESSVSYKYTQIVPAIEMSIRFR